MSAATCRLRETPLLPGSIWRAQAERNTAVQLIRTLEEGGTRCGRANARCSVTVHLWLLPLPVDEHCGAVAGTGERHHQADEQCRPRRRGNLLPGASCT